MVGSMVSDSYGAGIVAESFTSLSTGRSERRGVRGRGKREERGDRREGRWR